ncbi:hypothetical protein AC578_10569 [Pseudocercospora eumusae]|uniref:Uncharacterized protein n=1 Tax=Pseudocercospora eumusae TaxID=321146 RepID=A0A139H5E2_9PEZI|nr:hypothetical protein AC578_10569 [Pseudocercospora eumusae]
MYTSSIAQHTSLIPAANAIATFDTCAVNHSICTNPARPSISRHDNESSSTASNRCNHRTPYKKTALAGTSRSCFHERNVSSQLLPPSMSTTHHAKKSGKIATVQSPAASKESVPEKSMSMSTQEEREIRRIREKAMAKADKAASIARLQTMLLYNLDVDPWRRPKPNAGRDLCLGGKAARANPSIPSRDSRLNTRVQNPRTWRVGAARGHARHASSEAQELISSTHPRATPTNTPTVMPAAMLPLLVRFSHVRHASEAQELISSPHHRATPTNTQTTMPAATLLLLVRFSHVRHAFRPSTISASNPMASNIEPSLYRTQRYPSTNTTRSSCRA